MPAKKKQLLTYHDAVTVKRQHTKPCSDCPFARTAVPGWLADMSPETWMKVVHGDGLMECHTRKAPDGEAHQCAGAAIFRANVCKVSRYKEIMRLPRDTTLVFADNSEFLAHHKDKDPLS